jgi:hypothetical protein
LKNIVKQPEPGLLVPGGRQKTRLSFGQRKHCNLCPDDFFIDFDLVI